jgi:GNAT superfamily N-acetyltransferase
MRDSDDELVRVDELLTLAYDTPSRLRELELLQSVQPDGWYVIEDDGAPLAVAGCLVYGAFCWLGLVATHPDARGRGLASQVSSHLVEWAMARGCRTVALDASTLGRPVYERLGFRAAGATAELVRPAGTTPDPGTRAEQATPAAFDEIARFDRKVFGGDARGSCKGWLGIPSVRGGSPAGTTAPSAATCSRVRACSAPAPRSRPMGRSGSSARPLTRPWSCGCSCPPRARSMMP